MTPQLANRLVLGYILVSIAALLLIVPLAGLLGAIKGSALAVQGLPIEDLAIEVRAWTKTVTRDLFALASALAVGAFAYWFYRRYLREFAREIGWTRAPVFQVLKVAALLLLFRVGFAYFSSGLFPHTYQKELELPLNLSTSTPWGWVSLFFFIVLLAPLVEEWLFRGLMLRSYALRRGTRFALYAQALIFGLIHGKPMIVLSAIFMGWILGRVVLAGGSLQTAYWGHATFNLAGFLGTMKISQHAAAPIPENPTANAIFGLALVLFVLLVVARHWRPIDRTPVERGPVSSGSLWATLGYGLFALLSFLSLRA